MLDEPADTISPEEKTQPIAVRRAAEEAAQRQPEFSPEPKSPVELKTEAASSYEVQAEPLIEVQPESQTETIPEGMEEPASTSEMPDLEDTDATMAWLEALAAKQGADEATLVTSPEERSETPPDWLQEEITTQLEVPAEAQESTFPTEDLSSEAEPAELPDWLTMAQETPAKAEAVSLDEEEAPVSGLSEVPAEGEAAEAVPDFENIEDAMAWLEALAAKQGAEEGTLTTAPDERSETPPDWLQQEIAGQVAEADQAGENPFTRELAIEQPEVIPQQPVKEETSTEQPEAEAETVSEAAADFDDAFAWLESLAEKQGAEEGTLVTSPEDRLETPPDWLAQQPPEEEKSQGNIEKSYR